MSRSSRPGKKDIGDLVVSQGGRGLGLVLVLVVVSENTSVRIHSLAQRVLKIFLFLCSVLILRPAVGGPSTRLWHQ